METYSRNLRRGPHSLSVISPKANSGRNNTLVLASDSHALRKVGLPRQTKKLADTSHLSFTVPLASHIIFGARERQWTEGDDGEVVDVVLA